MIRRITPLLIVLLLLGLSLGSALAQDGLTVKMKISPNAISDVAQGPRNLTVHVDIAYGLVDAGSVWLEGIEAASIFPDDRGDLVAKFAMDRVRGLISEDVRQQGDLSLTLTGTAEGTPFSGSDTVRIVTCNRTTARASFLEGDGAFGWSRTFSRVCSQP